MTGASLSARIADLKSQLRNRELATERVLEQVRKAARPRRKRTATEPTGASRERRLDEKRKRGETKRLRQPPDD